VGIVNFQAGTIFPESDEPRVLV